MNDTQNQVCLVALLCGKTAQVSTMASLDPTDPRTRCFKRAAASFVAERLEDPELSDLGYLRGTVNINWDRPYCADLPAKYNDEITRATASSVTADSKAMSLMEATYRYIAPAVLQLPTVQANEFIRRMVNAVVVEPVE